MSVQPAPRLAAPTAHVRRAEQPAQQPIDTDASDTTDLALEFVRFCYRRRRVAWPELYDEMSVVAARGTFHGYGYGDLAERGISFCLSDLPRLKTLTERVVAEDERPSEPRAATATVNLAPA